MARAERGDERDMHFRSFRREVTPLAWIDTIDEPFLADRIVTTRRFPSLVRRVVAPSASSIANSHPQPQCPVRIREQHNGANPSPQRTGTAECSGQEIVAKVLGCGSDTYRVGVSVEAAVVASDNGDETGHGLRMC